MNILIPLLYTLGFALLGYLCGSLPFAIWITRLFKGVDVREAGSGHATTTARFARNVQKSGRSCLRRLMSPKQPMAAGSRLG